MRYLYLALCSIVPAIVSASLPDCAKDIERLCDTKNIYLENIKCLSKHTENLSVECSKSYRAFAKEKGPCFVDVLKLCKSATNLTADGNRSCLRMEIKNLSNECSSFILKAEQTRAAEFQSAWRLIIPHCLESFRVVCPADIESGGSVKNFECITAAFKAGKIKDKTCLAANEEAFQHLKSTRQNNSKNP